MAYKRRYYRKGYKGKRKYYKKNVLSKSRIFGNKSARGQAKQIYALNRRITKIEKQTKPEILNYFHEGFYFKMIDIRDNEKVVTDQFLLYHRLQNLDSNAWSYDGSLVRIPDTWLYLNFLLDRTATANYDAVPEDAYVRITLQKMSNSMDKTADFRLIHNVSGTTASQQGGFSRVLGPLTDGITSQGKIIYDRRIKLNSNYTEKHVKIHLKNIVLRNDDKVNYFDKNDIMICITYFNVSGDYVTHTNSPTVIKSYMAAKLAYVDDQNF